MENKTIKALEGDISRIRKRMNAENEKMTELRQKMFTLKYSNDFDKQPGTRLAYNIMADSYRRTERDRDRDMKYINEMCDELNSMRYGVNA